MTELKLHWPNPDVWDATRLRDLLLDPPRFYYNHMLSLEPGIEEREFNIDREFGRVYHAARAKYELIVSTGRRIGDAEALRASLATAWQHMEAWPKYADDPRLLKARGLSQQKNQYTMVRALCWHHETLGRDDNCTTLTIGGKPALEMTFSCKPFKSLPHVTVCGIIDRAVMYSHSHWLLDYKTTKFALNDAYFNRFQPDVQPDIYATFGRIAWPKQNFQGVIVEPCQLGVEFARFNRIFCQPSAGRCQEIFEMCERAISAFEALRKLHGDFKEGGLSDISRLINTACCSAGGGPCPSRRICAADPSDRLRVIRDFYHVRKHPWDPAELRVID